MGALVITVHGTPAPQGSKRHVGNGVMVESSNKVKPWREAVKSAALDIPAIALNVPLGCPVLVDVTFRLTRPRGHYRTGKNAHLLRDGAPVYPAGKPDVDKLLRSTLDALGDAGVWRDDSQVVAVTMRKLYGDVAGATIHVRDILVADDAAHEQGDVVDTGENDDPWVVRINPVVELVKAHRVLGIPLPTEADISAPRSDAGTPR